MSLESSRELVREAVTAAKEASGSKKKKRRTATRIPVRVEPGWVHYRIADLILEWFAAKIEGATIGEEGAYKLNVGQRSSVVPEEEDNREPVEILARIVAHMFYRLPFLKKVEKRLEGTDAKSGIASDLFALLLQLYERNKHLLPAIRQRISESAARQREERRAKSESAQAKEGREGDHGEVS